MPAIEPIPTIPQMLDAAAAELWARRPAADTHRGSVYDVQAGTGALLWIREANRDRDNFRGCYTDTCDGAALDWRITRFGGPARVESTKGTGHALVTRPTAAGGQGTFWAGTRVAIAALGQTPRFYRVSADTLVEASTTGTLVPVEAERTGIGAAVTSASLNVPRMWFEDRVWDSTWAVASVTCADGSVRESDAEYRARWRQGKLDRRPGYRKAISDRLIAEGAAYIALFESDHIAATDYGINRIFVADSAWQSPVGLLNRCRLALDSVRVAGCDTTVWGIVRTEAAFDLVAHLWEQPGNADEAAIRTAVQDGVLHYFSGRDNAFVFRRDGAAGGAMQACPALQSLTYGGSDPADTPLAAVFESTALPLLYTSRDLIRVTIAGPV